ncbi:MAG TPA: hydroxyacid dehydrogenase [Candidatus Paceibacterota bacterium]
MKIGFFGTKPWEKEYIEKLKGKMPGADLWFTEEILSDDHLPKETDFEAISVFVDSAVTKNVLEKFPNLKFIATRSTGYDHIDVAVAKAKGIVVSSVPSYGENTVAEMAFGLLLTLSRRIYEAYDRIREKGDWSVEGLQGFDLRGKTIGVVGTGRIGKHSIAIAKGFGMNVVGYDAYPNEQLAKELGFKYLSLDELLSVSDVVTLHVPFLPETDHMINKERIMKMKKGAVLINTSRGAVVETAALVEALKSGHLGGAGLDVLEEEGVVKDEMDFLVSGKSEGHDWKTIIANHVLIDMPNVVITPHNAFNTKEAIERILDTTVDDIAGYLSGKVINQVK